MIDKTIANRYEFMVLVEATYCNPNGDPDMENRPRQNLDTGHGIITEVAIKRRIRNYVEDAFPEQNIIMRSGTNLNRKIAEAVMAVNECKDLKNIKKGEKQEESQNWMCEKYWDVRTFGGVLSTGRNAGQIRGAVQVAMATSVDPITVEDMTITRMCYADKDFNTLEEFDDLDAKTDEDKKRTMGNKKVTPYGLYMVRGSISASLAEKTGFSEDDLSKLWEAILQMYNHDISSSKEGMSVISPLIIFKHVGTQNNNNEEKIREAKLGCAPAQMLFGLLDVHKKDDIEFPRKFDDYRVTFKASELPEGVEVGFKYLPFKDVEWNTDNLPNHGFEVV